MRLQILTHPHPALREVAKPVESIDDGVRQLVADMFETLYASGGIGLAAPQVGVGLRVVVVDLGRPGHRQPYCCINPEIVKSKGVQSSHEGCLSVPGKQVTLPRAKNVEVRARGADGKPWRMKACDLLAACFQHEIDHLNGRLLVDAQAEQALAQSPAAVARP